MSAVDFRQRLRELARFESSGSPVVSVYLNTEWVDEHQRERVRIFVKNALAEARGRRWADRDDLDWIERQSGTLIERGVFEDANGAVLFACGSASLRELLPLRVPFDDTFVVDARPYVRPVEGQQIAQRAKAQGGRDLSPAALSSRDRRHDGVPRTRDGSPA